MTRVFLRVGAEPGPSQLTAIPFFFFFFFSFTPQRKFLETLRKALLSSTRAQVEAAARTYVDIVVASTYVPKETTSSCLRHLVPPIESELKDRLFNPQKMIFDHSSEQDIELLVTCLVASFQLSYRGVILGFFLPFLSTGASAGGIITFDKPGRSQPQPPTTTARPRRRQPGGLQAGCGQSPPPHQV